MQYDDTILAMDELGSCLFYGVQQSRREDPLRVNQRILVEQPTQSSIPHFHGGGRRVLHCHAEDDQDESSRCHLEEWNTRCVRFESLRVMDDGYVLYDGMVGPGQCRSRLSFHRRHGHAHSLPVRILGTTPFTSLWRALSNRFCVYAVQPAQDTLVSTKTAVCRALIYMNFPSKPL